MKRLGIALTVLAATVASAAFVHGEDLRTTEGTKVDEKAWQRIRGTVESVSGSTLKLKADDGRVMTVNMTAVDPMVQKVLAPGDSVMVIGRIAKDGDRATARYIQQADPLGQASPPTEPKK